MPITLKLALVFSFVFCLNNTLASAQSVLSHRWEEELSKTKGQKRIDLIVQITKELPKENIVMADSLAREGIALARQMGDSVSMYRIGANLGRIFNKLNKLEKGIEWLEESLNYFEESESLAADKAECQLSLASLYILKRDFEKADILISDSEFFFETTDDSLWQSKILSIKGLKWFVKKEFEKSLTDYSEALKASEHLNDVDYICLLTRSIGAIKRTQGHYPEALELLFRADSMNCCSSLKARVYSEIGMTYSHLNDWELALKYYKKAVELKKQVGLEFSLAYSFHSIGIAHRRQLNFGEALKYCKQSLEISKKYKINSKLSETLGVIGNIYAEMGELEKADRYYDEQLELAKALDDWEGVWYVNYNRGYNLHKSGRPKEALKYIFESYEMAEQKGRLPFLLESSGMMANVHDALAEHEISSQYAEQYYMLADSIKSMEKMRKIGTLEQKHLTEIQKDNQNEGGDKDDSLGNDHVLSDKLKIIAAIGLLLLILAWSIWFFKKNKTAKAVEAENVPIDQDKIDRYFEELFIRLEEDKTTSEEVADASGGHDVPPVNDMAEFLKSKLGTQNDWASFEKYFERVHHSFSKNLKTVYPAISSNELNMCALLKLNLRNKEIAQIMGVSPDSVRKAQSRLTKKMELPSGEILRDFILKM